jgi:hypothetical protein
MESKLPLAVLTAAIKEATSLLQSFGALKPTKHK